MTKILLATDLDKTCLDDEARVPRQCLEAVARYVAAGGLFTIATGRPTRGALLYGELMELVNVPIVTYNGACIYDVRAGRALWRRTLEPGADELLRRALERFPAVGALVFQGEEDAAYLVRGNEYIHEVTWNREHYRPTPRAIEEIPGPWNKFVLAGPPEPMAQCARLIQTEGAGAFTVVLSEEVFLEVNGPGVSKGNALRAVAELAQVPREHVIAVGDSLNDLDMIAWAGWGVAVANAQEPVRRAARYRVPANTEYGVRACVEQIALPLLCGSVEQEGRQMQ